MFMILNESNDIMKLGWIDGAGEIHEECFWRTREAADRVLSMMLEGTVRGDTVHLQGMRVVEYPDA